MQQKFEVAVNLAQDFTDAQKAQGRANLGIQDVSLDSCVQVNIAQTFTGEQKAQARANIGCADLITIVSNIEHHTITSTESSNGLIELEIPLSDISFQSGHPMSISDFLAKEGLSFIRLAIRAYDNASLDLITDGTPIGIKFAVNDIQHAIYTVDALHKVNYVLNTIADILFKDFDYYMTPYNSPFVKIIIQIGFPNNAIPSGINLEYDMEWSRITD